MTTDVSTRIMKRTQMCALNVVLKESRRQWGELGLLNPLIIQLYIAKKLSSNCLTRLPATSTVLICLIGYLISSTRLLASTPHLTVLEVDQSLFLVLKFYLFYLIFMFFCEQYNNIGNMLSVKVRKKKTPYIALINKIRFKKEKKTYIRHHGTGTFKCIAKVSHDRINRFSCWRLIEQLHSRHQPPKKALIKLSLIKATLILLSSLIDLICLCSTIGYDLLLS